MPSPIAHAVSGYVLGKFILLSPSTPYQWRGAFFQNFYPVLIATVADFDFIPQILTGIRFHRGITHTLIFAMVFSGMISLIARYYRQQNYKNLFGFTLILYSSHFILDFFTDGGLGLQLFWPFTDMYFKSPIPFFPRVRHNLGLFDARHIEFIIFEICYSIMILMILYCWKIWQSRRVEEL